MGKSLLPEAGENKFQQIKKQRADAKANGINIIDLSIGQPAGPAILEARMAAAKAAMSESESMHEYQDNGSPGVPEFAQRFVQQHVKRNLAAIDQYIDFLPVPGIKPMLDVVIKALGAWTKDRKTHRKFSYVGTMTNPGYPTPRDQCQMSACVEHFELPMDPKEGFMFDPADLKQATDKLFLRDSELKEGDLLMLNFPHNPTGIVAEKAWINDLCKFCADQKIRLFNDAAYAILSHSDEATTLTDVAVNFPDLEWAEAFSASKAGNNTGWRIGAMVGSKNFLGDIKRVKGNSDSGFAAFAAQGIIDLFENHRQKIEEARKVYDIRLKFLMSLLIGIGMDLAVLPRAGFFALFKAPKRAFGLDTKTATEFNNLMIEKTGVVGVPFDSYIRYAVCTTDVVARGEEIREAFAQAQVKY